MKARDPWTIVIRDPNERAVRLPLEGQFLTPVAMEASDEIPADVFAAAVRAATTARQPPEFRLRGRGPFGSAPHGWTWSIVEGW